MNRAYLDACTIIYLVEAANPFHASAVEHIRTLSVDASSVLVTSRLSLLECRVRPLRENNLALLRAYDQFFSASRLIVWDVTAPIIDRQQPFAPAATSERQMPSTWQRPWRAKPTCSSPVMPRWNPAPSFTWWSCLPRVRSSRRNLESRLPCRRLLQQVAERQRGGVVRSAKAVGGIIASCRTRGEPLASRCDSKIIPSLTRGDGPFLCNEDRDFGFAEVLAV